MSTQDLKDKYGNRTGYIETDSSGRMVGRDKRYNKVGDYDPKSNITSDRYGNNFGTGNLLATLITNANAQL